MSKITQARPVVKSVARSIDPLPPVQTVLLSSLQVTHGTKTTIFNRRSPKSKPLTPRDIKRLSSQPGEIFAGKWQAVVDGVAFVISVEVEESANG